MPNDKQRCQILCELIDREPEDSLRAEMYVRLLWQILDKQLFPIPVTLRWRTKGFRMAAAAC